MTKNSLRIPLAFCMLLLLLFSCKKSDRDAAPANIPEPVAQNVEEQLKLSKQNLADHGLLLKLVSYKVESLIQTEDQLAAVKTSLLNSSNYVPQYNGLEAATFSVATIAERTRAAEKSPGSDDIVQNIRVLAFPKIKTGQKVMDILWEVQGLQFHSKCIYNDDGIVYDHILSNLFFVKSEEKAQEETKATVAGSTTSKTTAQYSFTSTVVNYTVTWVWGGTRGKIVIKHYIIWNGVNYIYDHGGTTDAWMSLGSASARWANNFLSRSSRSKMAWGYGWATPTASFKIAYNSSTVTFEATTGGVGSRGAGDGVHTIYL